MQSLFKGFSTTLSMFTILPFKAFWEEKSLKFVILSLPFVGLIIGVFWFSFVSLLFYFNINLVMVTALSILFPLFFTGFIHIDGFMDTMDAISSRAPMEKMQQILKDSHVGAFGVIYFVVMILLFYCSFYSVVLEMNLAYLIFIPITSRCVSSLLLLNCKPISENGFAVIFKKNVDNKYSSIIMFLLIINSFAALIFIGLNFSLLLLINSFICFLIGLFAVKKLGGINGDICGYVIVIFEVLIFLLLALQEGL